MRSKPKLFTIASLLLIVLAFTLPFEAHLIIQQNLLELKLLSGLLSSLAFLAGVALFIAHAYSIYLVPIVGALSLQKGFHLYFFLIESPQNQSLSSWASLSVTTLLGILPVFVLLSRNLSDIIFFQHLQWWKTPFRKKTAISVNILKWGNGLDSNHKNYESYDLSIGGAFLSLQIPELKNFKLGEKFPIALYLTPQIRIECWAEVVRKMELSHGEYPSGIGIQFSRLKWSDRIQLEQWTKSAPNAAQEKSTSLAA
jgi:hypothetical protein